VATRCLHVFSTELNNVKLNITAFLKINASRDVVENKNVINKKG
jgi:hypothetical protein